LYSKTSAAVSEGPFSVGADGGEIVGFIRSLRRHPPMVDANVLLGLFWIGCGLVILIPAALIAFGGRADLHIHYDEGVDPDYVSRRAGTTALLMGLLTVAYGAHQLLYGFSSTAFGGLLVALLILSSLTKRFAQGWGYDAGNGDAAE
jgi:hypothetical protein